MELEKKGVMVFKNPSGPLLHCDQCREYYCGRCAIDSGMDALCPRCSKVLGTAATSAQQAKGQDSVASVAPDYQEGDLWFLDLLANLPLWITLVVGTVFISGLTGISCYLVKDGFSWWSVLTGFGALGMLLFTAVIIAANRAPVAGVTGGPVAGGAYIGFVISVGCSLIMVWLVSRDGFFWWLLLPGFLALLGVIATFLCFLGYCEERRIHNR